MGASSIHKQIANRSARRGEWKKEARPAVAFESNKPERKQATAFAFPEITPHFQASVSQKSSTFLLLPWEGTTAIAESPGSPEHHVIFVSPSEEESFLDVASI